MRIRIPRLDVLYTALVILATELILGVLVWRLSEFNANSDYNAHIFFAIQLQRGGIYSTHLMLQGLILTFNALFPGIEITGAAWETVMIFYVATALVTYGLLRQATNRGWLAAVGALVGSIVAPVTILTWMNNLNFGYVQINALHNPTMVVLKPFALLTFAVAVAVLNGRTRINARTIALYVLLIALSIVAKPSFATTLLPALIVIAAYRALVQRDLRGAQTVLLGLILPLTLLLVIAYWLEAAVTGAPMSIGISPLVTVWNVDPSFESLALKLPLSILFPIGVYLLYRRDAKMDTGLVLGWWLFVSGAAQMYLLVEYGTRWAHGNFWWGAQIGSLILFVATLMFWFRQLRRDSERDPRFWITLLLLALHVASGMALYYSTMTLDDITLGW